MQILGQLFESLYVPPSACSALLHSIHSSPLSGHMGVFCTKSILEWDFWWPGLSTFIKHFIAGCAVCQQNKVNTHPTIPPLCPISSTISLPFKQLSVDLITNLPLSLGFDSVMVMVDHGLTKGVILALCSKTINAAGITQLFFDFIFKWFGLHDTVISDRGPQFASAFTKELACLLKYDVHLSTAYHPQTDGQTEWTNQELEEYLRIFCTNNLTKWAQLLPSAEFHHNSTPHSSTKTSPFSLLYGYESCSYPEKTFLPALKEQLSWLNEAQKEALAAHESAQKLMTSRMTCHFHPWKVGDKVWLEATHLSPFTYKLWLPSTWKIYNVFYTSLLSPNHSTEPYTPTFSAPPPDIIDNEEEYEVEAILSHKGLSSQRLYLTTWKGYPLLENMWEPEVNLCHSPILLDCYKQEHSLR